MLKKKKYFYSNFYKNLKSRNLKKNSKFSVKLVIVY